jgi:hypothetical protein
MAVVLIWTVAAIMTTSTDQFIPVDPSPPPALQAAADETLATLLAETGQECAEAIRYEELLGARMGALGFAAWKIERSPGIADHSCVAFGIAVNQQTVLLVPALPGGLANDLRAVAEETYSRCMTQAEVEQAVRTAASRSRTVGTWKIASDSMVGGPINRLPSIVAHVKSGCFIYSGTGADADGVRLFYVVGPQ